MDKDKELARLRALDTEQKARVLGKLESALAAADIHVFLSYEPHTETVHIIRLTVTAQNQKSWSTSTWTTLRLCSTTSLSRLDQSW